jgi:hypothetical protein
MQGHADDSSNGRSTPIGSIPASWVLAAAAAAAAAGHEVMIRWPLLIALLRNSSS